MIEFGGMRPYFLAISAVKSPFILHNNIWTRDAKYDNIEPVKSRVSSHLAFAISAEVVELADALRSGRSEQ